MEQYKNNEIEVLSKPRLGETGLISAEQSRAIQEVQASLIMAKRFPRNGIEAINNIMTACARPQVAATAMYAFPRKGEGGKPQTITGPTIKLLRVIAQNWGNMEFGTKELASSEGESTIEAFCWDKETNVREVRSVVIRHERKANNKITKLIDPRDCYEHVMAQAQRRVRACIEAVVPAYVIQDAVDACKRTLAKGDDKGPLIDRVGRMAQAFKELGVSQEMLERRLSHGLELTSADEFVELHQIYNAIKDGEQRRQDFFDFKTAGSAGVEDLNAKFGGEGAEP